MQNKKKLTLWITIVNHSVNSMWGLYDKKNRQSYN
jgi:hypothetical protein